MSNWYKCRCFIVFNVSQSNQKERCKVKKDDFLVVDETIVIYISFTMHLFPEFFGNYYFRE